MEYLETGLDKQRVIFVHGLGRRCSSMARLQREFDLAGYETICWSYQSRSHRLLSHIKHFSAWLESQNFDGKPHFIGHSLGGLIIRGALANFSRCNMGRIVLIATPNFGAGIVSKMGKLFLSRLCFGLPLLDLEENSNILSKLDVPDAEIGIIAGSRRFHPLNPISYINFFRLGKQQHDGTVELKNTKLAAANDFILLDAHHTFICNHSETATQCCSFVRTGTFQHNTAKHRLNVSGAACA